jgi:replicative DNA helicase
MQGHLTVITGPEGQGKTEIMRMFEYHILANHPTVPIAILHMEESKKTTLVSLASYMLGVNLRDPDHTVPQTTIDDAIDKLTKSENLYLFEFGVDDDPLAILEKVRYFKEACGCKYIFIDPIQQLSYGKDGESTEEQTLTKISVQLERLATEFNIGIVVTAHVKLDVIMMDLES